MKEFIEKLIGRLEEYQGKIKIKCGKRGTFDFIEVDAVKEIVNELAESYHIHCEQEYMRGYADAKNELAEEYKGGWIPCSERLPEDDTKQYIVQKTNGFIDILGFTKDAYKLDKYDFAEYKGKKQQFFYGYDSEYGYIEYECVAWMPLPEKYKGE